MKTLVFEPKFFGHYLGFAIQTANVFAQAGCEVLLAAHVEAEDSPAGAVKFEDLDRRVEVQFTIDVPQVYRPKINARHEAAALVSQLERLRPDHIVAPSGDFLLKGLSTNRRARCAVKSLETSDLILHTCQQAYPGQGLRRRIRLLRDQLAVAMSPIARLHTVDPYAVSPLAAGRVSLWGKPVKSLPHFYDRFSDAPSKSDARRELGLSDGKKVLGSIGHLGHWKGTELLIESFAASGSAGEITLALYGVMSPRVKATLSVHQRLVDEGRIVCVDRFVSEREFRLFFAAVDAFWAGYPRQIGIASTLLFAADAGLPVIASDFGCIGWLVREHGLGHTYSPNVHSMSQAIKNFAEADDWAPDTAGVERLLSHHTTENFGRFLTAGVRPLMQGNSDPNRKLDKPQRFAETS